MNLFAVLPLALTLSSLGCLFAAPASMSPRLQLTSLCDIQGVMGMRDFLYGIVTMPDEVVASLLHLAETNRAFAKSLAIKYWKEPTMRTCFNRKHTLKDTHLCILDKQAIEVSLLKILHSFGHHEAWMNFAPISPNSGLSLSKFHDSLEAVDHYVELSDGNYISLFDDWQALRETLTKSPYEEASMGQDAFTFFSQYATKCKRDGHLASDMIEKIALIAKGACDPDYREIADLLLEYQDVLYQLRLPYKTAVSTFDHFLLLLLASLVPVLNMEKTFQLMENHALLARSLPIDGLRECLQLYSTIDNDQDKEKRFEQQLKIVDITRQKIFSVMMENPEARRELLKAHGKQMRLPDDLLASALDSEIPVDLRQLKVQDIAREIEALPERLRKKLSITPFLIESNWRELKPVFKYYAGFLTIFNHYSSTDSLPDDPEDIPAFFMNKMLLCVKASLFSILALTTAYGRERTLLFRQLLDQYNAPDSGSIDSVIGRLYDDNMTKRAILMLPLAPGEPLPTDEHAMLNLMNRSPIDHARLSRDMSHIFLISEEWNRIREGPKIVDLQKSLHAVLHRKVSAYNVFRDPLLSGDYAIALSLMVEACRHGATHPRAVRWMISNMHVFQGNNLVRDNPSFSLLIKAIVDSGHRLCLENTGHVLKKQLLSTTLSHLSGDHLIQALDQTLLSLDEFDKLIITKEKSCAVLQKIVQTNPVTAVVPWDKVYAKVLEHFPGLERHAIPYNDTLKGHHKLSAFLTLKYWGHFGEFFTGVPRDSPAHIEVLHKRGICGNCRRAFTRGQGNDGSITRTNCCGKYFHTDCAAKTFCDQRACSFCHRQFFPLDKSAGAGDSEESNIK